MVPNIWLRRKALLEAILLPAIIILVALAAFGLGRLSVPQATQEKLIIHPPVSNSGETSQPGTTTLGGSPSTGKAVQ